MRWFKKEEDTIPFSEVYIVRIVYIDTIKNEDSFNHNVYLKGSYHLVYLDENLNEVDVTTNGIIKPYKGKLYSFRDDKNIPEEEKYGYINKELLSGLGLSSKLEQKIMVSHKDLDKLLKTYNKKKKKEDILLSSNEEEAKDELKRSGIKI